MQIAHIIKPRITNTQNFSQDKPLIRQDILDTYKTLNFLKPQSHKQMEQDREEAPDIRSPEEIPPKPPDSETETEQNQLIIMNNSQTELID